MTGHTPLVTVLGASGLVGSAVAAALARRPIRLRTVARRPHAVPGEGIAEWEFRLADLTVQEAVGDAVAGSDAVIHLVADAAGWRGADNDTAPANVDVMRDLVAHFRQHPAPGPPPTVVFAGSVSQVGPTGATPINGTEPDNPGTSYDRQKQTAEHTLLAASANGVVRGVSLRLPTVFGPGAVAADRGVVSTMARRALDGAPLTMWHDGTVERDLLYVDDVADAFVAALDHADALAGRHWLLGTGQGVALGDAFRMVADVVSVHTGRTPVPVLQVPAPDGATSADLHGVVVDSSAFRAVTGWSPRVPLRAALHRTVVALAAEPDSSSGTIPRS